MFQNHTVITKHSEISAPKPFLLKQSNPLGAQPAVPVPTEKALLNMASQLRVISSIITILFVKREGLKMTAASILNDISEWNAGLHYQMGLLSEALQSLPNIPFS